MSINKKSMNCIAIGDTGSGKSWFISGIAGAPITYVSNLKNTMYPISYKLSPDGTIESVIHISKDLEKIKKIHEDYSELINTEHEFIVKKKLKQINTEYEKYPIKSDLDITITDYPGFDNTNDPNKLVMKSFEEIAVNYDIVFYVCDINNAFTKRNQIENVRKVMDIIEKTNCEELTNIELFIICTNCDDSIWSEVNEELKQQYENIPERVKMSLEMRMYIKGEKIIKGMFKGDTYTISKSNIFRIDNYSFFAERCLDKIYISTCVAFEMNKMKNYLFGKYNNIKIENNCKKPTEFNESIGFGDLDNLIDKLKRSNELLEKSRIENIINYYYPEYDCHELPVYCKDGFDCYADKKIIKYIEKYNYSIQYYVNGKESDKLKEIEFRELYDIMNKQKSEKLSKDTDIFEFKQCDMYKENDCVVIVNNYDIGFEHVLFKYYNEKRIENQRRNFFKLNIAKIKYPFTTEYYKLLFHVYCKIIECNYVDECLNDLIYELNFACENVSNVGLLINYSLCNTLYDSDYYYHESDYYWYEYDLSQNKKNINFHLETLNICCSAWHFYNGDEEFYEPNTENYIHSDSSRHYSGGCICDYCDIGLCHHEYPVIKFIKTPQLIRTEIIYSSRKKKLKELFTKGVLNNYISYLPVAQQRNIILFINNDSIDQYEKLKSKLFEDIN